MQYSSVDNPEKIPKVFVEAWNNRDAAQIAALFSEDAEFVNVTGLWWHSRDAIEKAHDYGLRTIFNRSTLSIVRLKIKYLASNIAVVNAKMKLTGQTATAKIETPGKRTNIFTFVLHKRGEDWQCVAAQNTDIVPGMETHVRSEDGDLRAVSY